MVEKTKPFIIVIGAGVSGITASFNLIKKGYDVLILEGRDRIGGRIFTHKPDNNSFFGKVDLGASWIHGLENNEIFDLSKKQNVQMIKFDYEDTTIKMEPIILKNSDLESNNEVINEKYREIGSNFIDYMHQVRNDSRFDDPSIKEILDDYIAHTSLNEQELICLNTFVYTKWEADLGAKLESLSALYYDDQEDDLGGDMFMTNGYFDVFEKMTDGLNIKLNSKVKSIDQTKIENKVVIEVSNQTEKYTADLVIVTVPLGVLKSDSINFIPQLSINKQIAIKKLGFETFEKVYVEFSEAFWENTTVIEFINHTVSPISFAVNLNKIGCNKNSLCFIIGGGEKYWPKYYSSSKEDKIKFVVDTLSAHYPNKTIKVINLLSTDWHNDEFSLGSYSSFVKQSNSSMVKEFSSNEGKLYFAGEHTNYERKETVRGAYLSGLRVFNQIINLH